MIAERKRANIKATKNMEVPIASFNSANLPNGSPAAYNILVDGIMRS
jgi:hypothetical protein